MATYIEHSRAEVHGFDLVDATQSGGTPFDHDNLVWIGCCGEGRWLTRSEALELAIAINNLADAHWVRHFTAMEPR